MEKFIETVKGNPEVKVVPVPVAWNDDLAIFPHTYYAFEALGRMGDLHMEFWTWVIRGSHDWSSAADIERMFCSGSASMASIRTSSVRRSVASPL